MIKRTTIELDQELLLRAKRALGVETTRATVEEALRRVAEQGEGKLARRAADQSRYLKGLPQKADLEVLTADEMWR